MADKKRILPDSYTVCLYVRLSVEDDNLTDSTVKDESGSITSQRQLIRDYMKARPEFSRCRIIERCDDGFSGTHFDSRPACMEMIEMAKRGEIDVIIGPRSALFTPFDRIGFIIIDEEHESTYQSENIPRYDAREVAIALAKQTGAAVVLGSATPSVESYYRARTGQYRLYEMRQRVQNKALAQVKVVDLREELKSGNRSVISTALGEAIQHRLDRREQTMLFLNRRGMAGFVSCRACGHVLKCPHCDVSLSEHRGGRLVCHYCGYSQPTVRQCPACGAYTIGTMRAGTQKMEEVVQKAFPKARVLRMDADTTKEKEGHAKILSAFANQEADILVGTQMIVKGHDFPNVTLVGVLAADLSLHAPDYRAAERTFQLLTQAAGRAGRGNRPGEVIIQTYQPEHFSIRTAQAQDFIQFYKEEMQFRSLLHYPPSWHLMEILFSGPRSEEVAQGATMVRRLLTDTEAAVIGPADPSIAKLKDTYRKVIYIKQEERDRLVDIKDRVEAFVKGCPEFARVYVQFDFQ